MTKQQQQHAPSMTLAEKALRIYDSRGEFATLPFLMASIRAIAEPGCWIQDGFCLLEDGSKVQHRHGRYTFTWHDPATNQRTSVQRRSAMPDDGRPDPIKTQDTPVLSSPNYTDIWLQLLDTVESMSASPPRQIVIHDFDLTHQLAPSLHGAIMQAISETDTSQYTDSHFDNICRDVAAAAVALVQPQEFQALVDHATDRPEPTTPQDPRVATKDTERPDPPPQG